MIYTTSRAGLKLSNRASQHKPAERKPQRDDGNDERDNDDNENNDTND